MAADWTHRHARLSRSLLHELSGCALTSHLAGGAPCVLKKTLAKNSRVENDGFRIGLGIQQQQQFDDTYGLRPLMNVAIIHMRCAIVTKGGTKFFAAPAAARCLWMAPRGVDSPLKIALPCHHISHAGDAAGSRRSSTASIAVASWRPFCSRLWQSSCCDSPPGADSSHAATPLPPDGPSAGSWRCPLRLPHATALYLLQGCPPALSRGSYHLALMYLPSSNQKRHLHKLLFLWHFLSLPVT